MKERTLLDLMTQIHDDFIAEAAHPEMLLALQRKRRRALWVKRISGVAACLIVAVGIVSAIPYLRVMSRNEEAAIQDAINAAVNTQSSAIAQSSVEAEKAEDILSNVDEAEKMAAEESLMVANEAAEKAAKEASEKAAAAEKAAADAKKEAESIIAEASKQAAEASKQAAEASKQAAEASKQAAEASKQAAEASKQAAEASKEVTAQASTNTADPKQESDGIDQVSFANSNHILISFTVNAEYHLLELILPEEIKGNIITTLDQDFWRFCRLYSPNLKRVAIPSTIVEFGDITFLPREVEILCEKGSAAEIFFTAQGYTVIILP